MPRGKTRVKKILKMQDFKKRTCSSSFVLGRGVEPTAFIDPSAPHIRVRKGGVVEEYR